MKNGSEIANDLTPAAIGLRLRVVSGQVHDLTADVKRLSATNWGSLLAWLTVAAAASVYHVEANINPIKAGLTRVENQQREHVETGHLETIQTAGRIDLLAHRIEKLEE